MPAQTSKKFFVTGIGTGIGKTFASAVICQALQADYFKPVQSGLEGPTDSETVAALLSNPKSRIHPEAWRLRQPLSPHLAARLDGVEIAMEQIRLPVTDNHLLVEGAGGLLVPLNRQQLLADLIAAWQMPVIVVVRHYLGSINHSLLTLEALASRQIRVAALVFVGETNPDSEEVILSRSPAGPVLRLGQHEKIDRQLVAGLAVANKEILHELIER